MCPHTDLCVSFLHVPFNNLKHAYNPLYSLVNANFSHISILTCLSSDVVIAYLPLDEKIILNTTRVC